MQNSPNQFGVRPHRRHTQIVRSLSSVGANVHLLFNA